MAFPIPPPGRWGCLGWLLALATVALLGIAVLGLWMCSDADLRAVEVRARDLGVPTTWSAIGLPPTPPARLAAIRRLAALQAAAKSYEGWYPALGAFTMAPPEVAAWVAAGGSGVDSDLDTTIDGMDPGPWTTLDPALQDDAFARRDWQAVGNAFKLQDGLHGIVEEYRIRIAVADPAAKPELIRRLYRIVMCDPLHSGWGGARAASRWAQEVAAARGSGVQDPEWAAEAESLADALAAHAPIAARIEWLRRWQLLHAPAFHAMRQLNLKLPAIMANPVSMRFFYRSGRTEILQRAVDIVAWTDRHACPRTIAAIDAMVPPYPEEWYNIPHWLLPRMMDSSWMCGRDPPIMAFLLSLRLQAITQLRLLAADLRGATWPADPCDPAGAPLRPVVRDGITIGAYGCGPDGVDDHGDCRRDWCWPLRAALGSPRAADPLPAAP